MKNFIIILVIIAVLFIGYKTLSKKNTEPITQTPATQGGEVESKEPSTMEKTKTPTEQKIVNYTANGFEPSSMTISIGETITFVNETEKSMRVASDPHPAHTDLSVFDEKTGVEKGKSYSFTFEKKGTWGYHNHLSARDKGTIIVE